MRSPQALYRLTFLLPAGIIADAGRHAPSLDGCELLVTLGSLVEISGPSKNATFEHAARLLRVTCRGRGPVSIFATLESPPPITGRDTWNIIVGAEVAFSPTPLGPEFPRMPAERPAALVLLQGGRSA